MPVSLVLHNRWQDKATLRRCNRRAFFKVTKSHALQEAIGALLANQFAALAGASLMKPISWRRGKRLSPEMPTRAGCLAGLVLVEAFIVRRQSV